MKRRHVLLLALLPLAACQGDDDPKDADDTDLPRETDPGDTDETDAAPIDACADDPYEPNGAGADEDITPTGLANPGDAFVTTGATLNPEPQQGDAFQVSIPSGCALEATAVVTQGDAELQLLGVAPGTGMMFEETGTDLAATWTNASPAAHETVVALLPESETACLAYELTLTLDCGDPVPDPGPAFTPGTAPVYLFEIGRSNGSLGGRTGADARARTALPVSLTAGGGAWAAAALLSVTGDDLRDLPTSRGVPADQPVYGVQSDGTLTRLADTWGELFTAPLQATVGAALGYASFEYFWTGTDPEGAATGVDCDGWTSVLDEAHISNRSSATEDWLQEVGYGATCASNYKLLGVAWCTDC